MSNAMISSATSPSTVGAVRRLRTTGKAVMQQIRIDWWRVAGSGKGILLFWLLSNPILVFISVINLTGNGMVAVGIVCGYYACVSIIPVFNCFYYEQTGNNAWMNGIVPISQTHQLMGRQAELVLQSIAAGVEVVICCVLVNIIGYCNGGMIIGIDVIGISVIFTIISNLFLGSVALPLLYKFASPQTAMLVTAGGLLIVFLLFDLMGRLAPVPFKMFSHGFAYLAQHYPALLLVAAVAVPLIVSYRIAKRIQQSKNQ